MHGYKWPINCTRTRTSTWPWPTGTGATAMPELEQNPSLDVTPGYRAEPSVRAAAKQSCPAIATALLVRIVVVVRSVSISSVI